MVPFGQEVAERSLTGLLTPPAGIHPDILSLTGSLRRHRPRPLRRAPRAATEGDSGMEGWKELLRTFHRRHQQTHFGCFSHQARGAFPPRPPSILRAEGREEMDWRVTSETF